MTRHLLILCWALFGVAAGFSVLGVAGDASSQAAQESAAGDVILVKGIAADATGPLGGKVVIAFPLEAPTGKPVTRHSSFHATLSKNNQRKATRNKEGALVFGDEWEVFYTRRQEEMINPQATTTTKAAFSLKVAKGLFKDPPGCVTCTGYKAGQLGLGVFQSNGFVSYHEIEIISFDEGATTADVGRLVFKPLK